jgi:hypothetical protein
MKKKPIENPSMLQQAEATISGPRQADYGDKLANFSQIAMLWQGVLARKLGADSAITPEDVALCMIQVKVARLSHKPDHFDSILDVAGYAGCYSVLQDERLTAPELPGAIKDSRAE